MPSEKFSGSGDQDEVAEIRGAAKDEGTDFSKKLMERARLGKAAELSLRPSLTEAELDEKDEALGGGRAPISGRKRVPVIEGVFFEALVPTHLSGRLERRTLVLYPDLIQRDGKWHLHIEAAPHTVPVGHGDLVAEERAFSETFLDRTSGPSQKLKQTFVTRDEAPLALRDEVERIQGELRKRAEGDLKGAFLDLEAATAKAGEMSALVERARKEDPALAGRFAHEQDLNALTLLQKKADYRARVDAFVAEWGIKALPDSLRPPKVTTPASAPETSTGEDVKGQ